MTTSLALLLLYTGICAASPSGASEEACANMTASHGREPKNACEGYAEGYRLVQEKENYLPGGIITVSLYTVRSPFKGFPIKAFVEDENDVGTFRSMGPESKALSRCSGIRHVNNNNKTRVVVKWLAPEDRSGKVHFKATVVKRFRDNYHGLRSAVAQPRETFR